jgi:hypothetical protein
MTGYIDDKEDDLEKLTSGKKISKADDWNTTIKCKWFNKLFIFPILMVIIYFYMMVIGKNLERYEKENLVGIHGC